MLRFLLLFALLLLLASAFIWLDTKSTVVSQSEAPVTSVVVSNPTVQASEQESNLDNARSHLISSVQVERKAFDPQGFNLKQGSIAADGGVLVTVIDALTDARVPGASVSVIDIDRFEVTYAQCKAQASMGFQGAFDYASEFYVADEVGQVRIPMPKGRVALTGSSVNRFKMELYHPMRGDQVGLRLEPAISVPVHVIDELGEGVGGVRVSIHGDGSGSFSTYPSGNTDLAGMVHIRVTEMLKERWKDQKVAVVLGVLDWPAPMAFVDLNNLPEQPIVLKMPATGQVEVVVLNARGQPSEEDFQISLGLLLAEEHEWESLGAEGRILAKVRLGTSLQGGKVLFPHVALHQRFWVVAELGEIGVHIRTNGFGPNARGEKSVITVDSEKAYLTLVGRILNTEGALGRDLMLKAEIRHQQEDHDSTDRIVFNTNSEGRFKFREALIYSL